MSNALTIAALISAAIAEVQSDLRLCVPACFALKNALGYFDIGSEVVPVNVLVTRRHPSLPYRRQLQNRPPAPAGSR